MYKSLDKSLFRKFFDNIGINKIYEYQKYPPILTVYVDIKPVKQIKIQAIIIYSIKHIILLFILIYLTLI